MLGDCAGNKLITNVGDVNVHVSSRYGVVNVDSKVVSLYFAADRKYNENEILNYLKDDYYIICDRYVSSNMAHQGSKIKNVD